MPNYRYEIKQASGQVSAGLISAESSRVAIGQLRSQGGYILSLLEMTEKSSRPLLESILSFKIQMAPSQKDILHFTRQLAVMIRAGISIRAALEGIVEQVENEKFRDILHQVRHDVEAGKCFSDALAKYPKVFSPLYINMVRASELSGSFGHMLDRIAGYMAHQIETRGQVRGAMIYPIIIAVMAVVTIVFMLTYVLPKFVAIFEGKEAALPAPTKIILAISHVFCNFWYLIVGGLAGVIWTSLWLISTDWGSAWWDRAKLTMPIIKKLARCLCISRSLQTMGELVNAGVPMLDTISITAHISGNTVFKKMWHRVFVAVKQGKKISDPLTRSALLPKSVIQMISAGEESGKLSEVLRDISDYYQNELKNIIRAVTAMIEPLMIVIMGVIVGFIAMSIILPVFKLSTLVKG